MRAKDGGSGGGSGGSGSGSGSSAAAARVRTAAAAARVGLERIVGRREVSGKGSGGSGSGDSGDGSGKGGGPSAGAGGDDGGSHDARSGSNRAARSAAGQARGQVVWSRVGDDGAEVRYSDGWSEQVARGRYRLRDPARRVVVERSSKRVDLDRLRSAAH